MIFNLLPYVRELNVVTSFSSNKTSLKLKHWLTIDDVSNTLKSAKFVQKSRVGQAFGKAASPWIKFLFLIASFIAVILTTSGPLLPFSSLFQNNEEYKINSANVKIDFLGKGDIKLGTIFESNLMLNTRTINMVNDTQWQFLAHSDKSRTQEAKFFKRVQLSPYSQTFHEFQLSMDNYDTDPVSLEKELVGGNINIEISFRVKKILILDRRRSF